MEINFNNMQNWLRREYAQLLTSGAQLLLLFLAIRLYSRNGWLYCLSAIALISVFAWLSSLYRMRTIRNTPISKIASAAQGYVNVVGKGNSFGDTPLFSQLRRRPCLWCRYKIEKRDRDEWITTNSGETSDSFILRDDTGECIIDPDYAEITTQHYEQWKDGNERFTEWRLAKNDLIHVIGQFRTQGGSTMEFDMHKELGELLADWKKDMPALLARFDLNKDGLLDMDEWNLARQAARRDVEKMMREAQATPDFSIISRPPDNQFFLISNFPRERLYRRYLLWAWVHLLIFFGSLRGVGWVLQNINF